MRNEALSRRSGSGSGLTQFGQTIVGTWYYAPLEQRGERERDPDAKSDLYSFGATLYRLLTGEVP